MLKRSCAVPKKGLLSEDHPEIYRRLKAVLNSEGEIVEQEIQHEFRHSPSHPPPAQTPSSLSLKNTVDTRSKSSSHNRTLPARKMGCYTIECRVLGTLQPSAREELSRTASRGCTHSRSTYQQTLSLLYRSRTDRGTVLSFDVIELWDIRKILAELTAADIQFGRVSFVHVLTVPYNSVPYRSRVEDLDSTRLKLGPTGSNYRQPAISWECMMSSMASCAPLSWFLVDSVGYGIDGGYSKWCL
ncbi:uncharacterized protein EV420DRAFT_1753759 [Desarmillaria tabescens]|uniref:Uncharacterized protein n=1 Tax=Armillaria tabescens TaxID=1929756 RepID=A0AA39MK29_ARMTA|nr:uncharacterized protein EV420DRAFT_1753759 [Desarmillaria tabescens]KAK0436340.1 hypothetical protein EV420DRAFT_1753759 [Desarmillaria tabescens]